MRIYILVSIFMTVVLNAYSFAQGMISDSPRQYETLRITYKVTNQYLDEMGAVVRETESEQIITFDILNNRKRIDTKPIEDAPEHSFKNTVIYNGDKLLTINYEFNQFVENDIGEIDILHTSGLSEDWIKGQEKFMGKTCQIYEAAGDSKFWMWDGVMLKSEMRSGSMRMLTETINIEENINIEEGFFDLPEGVQSKNIEDITQELMKQYSSVVEGAGTVPDHEKVYLNSKLRANDALAQSTLRSLSTATETYATEHRGNYPIGMNELLEADTPYLYENFCDKELSGYKYECLLSNDGYEFKAVPVAVGTSGTTVFTITTYGVLNP